MTSWQQLFGAAMMAGLDTEVFSVQSILLAVTPWSRIRNVESARVQSVSAVRILLAVALACSPVFGADTGTLSVSVHEPGSEIPLPCRAWVSTGSERVFTPVTEACTPYAKDRSFSCAGHFVIRVPVGKATIHVERGKEYWPIDKAVVVAKDQDNDVDITLRRWVNMCRERWYSADMHCHFGVNDLKVLKQLALADDINFEPILTLWNHRIKGMPVKAWPNWPEGPTVHADTTHLITLRNQEIERIGGEPFESIGALLMFGLSKPVGTPLQNGNYPCDAVLGEMAKRTSPECVIDTDKPIWGENVVGVALGLFDSVQICHNHYHRESTLRLGWGMAAEGNEQGQDDWGQDELFHRTNLTYYRFLNCGFKLAVTGGSAMGVMPVPLGHSRTYAKLDGPLTEANYLQAIRAGRTFATSGPILILTANGLDSGAEIRYSTNQSRPVLIKAQLRSIHPVDSLELISDGKVIRKIDLADRLRSTLLTESVAMELKPKRSGWLAARAVFTGSDGRLRQAHTSPVYITVDGKPTASRKDAEYMIRWIDRLIQVSEKPGRYHSDSERTQSQALFRKARKIYQHIARTAAES